MLQAVSIKNYLSFKEQKRLQVRDGKLVVVGEDGAGKTNLFRAVKFALQSQPIRWNGESMCPWDCNDELDVSIDVDMIAEDVAILRDFITFKLFSKLIDHCKEDTGEYMDQFEAFLKDNDVFTQLRLGYRSEAFNKQYLQPFCETLIKGHYQLVSFRHNTQIDFFANCLPDDVYSKIDKDDLDKPLNFSGFYGNSYFTAKWEQRALKMQELTAGLRQTSFSLLMRKMVATRFVFFSDHIDSFLSGSESLVKSMDYAGVEKLLFEKKMSRTRQGRFEFKTIQEHMKHLANIVPDVGLTDTTSRLSVRFGESDTSTLLPRVFFTEVDGHTFDAGTASSGVSRLLTILAVLHTSDYLTCFLDEPLETLHPALRHHMRDHFLTVKNKAIIMITHAGEMIVPPLLDHTYRFRTQFKNNQGSSTEVYDIKQVLRARKDIKMELINLSVESSFREIFFTRSVIFVEGINDKRVLDSLSFVIRHKKSVKMHDIKHIHWSVIAIGGKGRFPAAVHLAKNMGLEWVCLMDLDALLPDDEHIRAQLKENGSKAKQIDVTFHEYKDTLQQVLQDLNKIASKKGLPVPQNPSPIPSPSRAVATSVGTPPDLLPAPPLSPASESIASETTVSPQQSTTLLSANNNSNNQQQTNATPTITISATPNVVPEVTGEDSDLTKVIEYVKGVKSRVDISLKSVEKNRHKLEAQGDLERWNLASTHQSAAYLVIKQHFLGPNEDFFNTRNHHLDAFLNYCSERRVFSWRNGALESLFQITFPDFTKSRWSKLFYAELVELVRKLVEDDKNTEVTRLLNFLKRWNCLEMSSGPRTEL